MGYKSLLLPLLLCAGVAQAEIKQKHTASRDTMQSILLDTMEVTTKAAKPPYQGAAPKVWQIENTRVALTFDWKGKTANAREWIKLHPYYFATDNIVLDAKDMRIDSVELMAKGGNKPLQYVYANDQLTVNFGRIYAATDSVVLYLKYTAMPYSQQSGGSAAITDDRGLYFINTDNKVLHKPQQIWTQGETESNSHWMITLDKPNTKFTTQIELTVPDSMTTLGNGALIKQTKLANGQRLDVWKQDKPIQAYVVMFAIGKFSVIKDKWKGKEVNYYVEPEYAQYARQMFNNTSEMMEYFSQITGVEYPWNKYSQVVVRDYVSGAMENTTASLFGEFMNQNAREIADKNSEDVVSHELFHQWFGDYVTCESWSNITVNESFANYGEQLWRRHKYGKEAGDALAWNELQPYLYTTQIKDPQLVRFNYDSREEVFDAISYNKGGAILHYLNTIIGDAAFNRAMKIYLTKNALGNAEAHNWRLAVEEATGQDWNWFFNQWYYHAGHPVLKVNYNYGDTMGKLVVTVSQTQEDSTMDYNLPLKTSVIYGTQHTEVDWNITKRDDTFTYAYKNGVRPVIVPDNQHILPGQIKENKKPAEWIAQYRQSDDYVSKRLAIGGACKQMSDSNTQELIGLALNDESKFIRKYTLGQLSSMQSDKYKKTWAPKLMEIAKGDKDKGVRAMAVDVLGTWKWKAANDVFLSAVNDSSYALAGSSLDALSTTDKDTAYAIAKQLAKTQPRGDLQATIWEIIGNRGNAADAAYYEAEVPYVQGTKVFAMAQSLNKYLKKVDDDAAFSRVVDVYTTFIILEEKKSYRGYLGGFLFQVASEQKENAKSDNAEEKATAQRRLAIVKKALGKVVAAEGDKSQLEDFNKKMKDTFE